MTPAITCFVMALAWWIYAEFIARGRSPYPTAYTFWVRLSGPVVAIILMCIGFYLLPKHHGVLPGKSSTAIREVMTTVSFKNEAADDVDEAAIALNGRSFGFGLVAAKKKKSMGAGNLAALKSITIDSSTVSDKGDIKNHRFDYAGTKVFAVAPSAGEIEVVRKGDETWVIRLYGSKANGDGPVILEEEVQGAKATLTDSAAPPSPKVQ
jgi:hypothetical protein